MKEIKRDHINYGIFEVHQILIHCPLHVAIDYVIRLRDNKDIQKRAFEEARERVAKTY